MEVDSFASPARRMPTLPEGVLLFRRGRIGSHLWETEFYTPPVLGGAALLPFSAPAVYKNPVP